ncbi:MarR family transcriptional regulator [Blautia wexlerae]|uniref:winged helix-turn-helix transcriptional regulator n=1 Tax=Blautia wexlerae TaxID=418240 RepID=UPI00156EDE31|nr:winged helix-turn-helix transcriptional regulator [Blautia wexlerae]NSF62397.1 MarR family transcriptional regulator [Blautia wexlerae]
MSEKEFDRGKCFTFFASYRKQGERIKEILGPEKALEYYEAVIDYGLYAKPIDNNLLLYVGDTLLETIDSSQEKRSRAFGENMTITRSILETVRDHPEYSQNQVAQELQISKGKVNKVLTKYRAGGYADDVDFNLVINKVEYTPDGTVVSGTGTNYNTNTNYNNNNNSTDRYRDHQRDRLDGLVAGSLGRVAGAPNVVASAPNSADAARLRLPDDLPEDIRNIKFEARIDDKSMLEVMDRDYRDYLDDGWETHEDIRDKLIEKFTTGFYCGDKDKVTAYAEFLMEHYKI